MLSNSKPLQLAEAENPPTVLLDNVYALKLILLVLLGVALAIGIFALNPENYTSSQKDWFISLNSWLSLAPNFWENVTTLGDALVLFPLLSFLLLSNGRMWAALIGSIPMAVLLSHAGKAFFSMPRPASVLDVQQFVVIGGMVQQHSALPSGHTTTIFTAVTAIIGILLYEKKLPNVRLWVIVLLCVAFIIALSRVAVGAHWPLDLLLGAICGVFAGVSGVLLTFKFNRWWTNQSIMKFSYLHAAFLWVLCQVVMSEYQGLVISWVSCSAAIIVMFYLLKLKTDES